MAAIDSTEDIDSAPLNSRELDYFRSRIWVIPPRMLLVGASMAVATGLAMVITSPALQDGSSLFALGATFAIGLVFTLSIYKNQRALRADVAGGIKLWRAGHIHAAWTSEDSESGRTNHSIEIAIDRDPQGMPMAFTVPFACYHSIEKGDRIRVAYSPNGRHLLELIDGNYRYVVIDDAEALASPPSNTPTDLSRPD